MTRTIRTIGALLAVLTVMSACPAAAAPPNLADKRKEATRLQREIAEQGRRLSLATEDFNEARATREGFDLKVVRARKELQRAEERWVGLKARLGKRARMLYMHPAIWAAPFFGASDINQLERSRVLASNVVIMDTDLLFQTEKARGEITARKADVEKLRKAARAEEQALEGKRKAVEKELRAAQAVLGKVQGEIATLIEQERQRQLEAARQASANKKKVSFGVPAPQNVGPVGAAAAKAIATAQAQLGKPYRWGADGPDAYDCSGLTMYAWAAAGVSLPHSSRAQYASGRKVANDQIQPGDLLYFGSPIHHVGIYEGGGVMLNAPETGENVRRNSIYRKDFVGATRPG